MARIFAYIVHKDGVADDTAAEMAPIWMLFARLFAHPIARYGNSPMKR
jgi:hypothetical protein